MPSSISSETFPLHSLPSLKFTASEYSTTSTATLRPMADPFTPTTTLQIQAAGKAAWSLPMPPKELTTPIFSPHTRRPVYLSLRPSRGSGSCRLVSAEDATETTIATTQYWFGPGRNPEVRVGREDDLDADVFEVAGKGLWTRAVVFESRRWGRFEWRYGNKMERAASDGVNNLLILERVDGGAGKEERTRVAQLSRSEETRAAGSSACSAGNGGRLDMCLSNAGGILIDDVTAVVTCLVVLKKEVDRLRTIQIMAIAAH